MNGAERISSLPGNIVLHVGSHTWHSRCSRVPRSRETTIVARNYGNHFKNIIENKFKRPHLVYRWLSRGLLAGRRNAKIAHILSRMDGWKCLSNLEFKSELFPFDFLCNCTFVAFHNVSFKRFFYSPFFIRCQ